MKINIRFGLDIDSYNEVIGTGLKGALRWKLFENNNVQQTHNSETQISSAIFINENSTNPTNTVKCELKIYNSTNVSELTFLSVKIVEITIDRTTSCPINTSNTLSISTNETSLCPGASTTITTNTNCSATSISWQKDGVAYGSNGATTSVSTSGI